MLPAVKPARGSVHTPPHRAYRQVNRLRLREIRYRDKTLWRAHQRFARNAVTHRGRRVAINTPEVPLTVHQGIAHVEILRHAH